MEDGGQFPHRPQFPLRNLRRQGVSDERRNDFPAFHRLLLLVGGGGAAIGGGSGVRVEASGGSGGAGAGEPLLPAEVVPAPGVSGRGRLGVDRRRGLLGHHRTQRLRVDLEENWTAVMVSGGEGERGEEARGRFGGMERGKKARELWRDEGFEEEANTPKIECIREIGER